MRALFFCILLCINVGKSKEPINGLGDTLQLVIPAAGLATTIYLQDWEGTKQWSYSVIVTQAVTEGLKSTIREKRPSPSTDTRSFPSGHTSGAFSGAAFIQRRYGWEYSIPAYIGAAYTGWSRVELRRHYTHDVLAGALIGILSSYIFTTPYEESRIQLFYEQNTVGVQVAYKW